MDRARGLLFTMMMALAAGAAAQEPRLPLPLDPLTPAERDMATRIADVDPRVREMIGTQWRRIYTEFIAVKEIVKTESEPPSGRFAEVLYIRYDTNSGVRALVDLAARRVADVARASGRSVPMNVEELEVAAQLALRDPRVTSLLGEDAGAFHVARGPAVGRELTSNRIEGLRTVGANDRDRCYDHRCIVLFFRRANRYVHLNEVIVDLTAHEVVVGGGQP